MKLETQCRATVILYYTPLNSCYCVLSLATISFAMLSAAMQPGAWSFAAAAAVVHAASPLVSAATVPADPPVSCHVDAGHPALLREVPCGPDPPVGDPPGVDDFPQPDSSAMPTGLPLQNQKGHTPGPALDPALGPASGLCQVPSRPSSPSGGCPVHGMAIQAELALHVDMQHGLLRRLALLWSHRLQRDRS